MYADVVWPALVLEQRMLVFYRLRQGSSLNG
jgi:hypothetical protein